MTEPELIGSGFEARHERVLYWSKQAQRDRISNKRDAVGVAGFFRGFIIAIPESVAIERELSPMSIRPVFPHQHAVGRRHCQPADNVAPALPAIVADAGEDFV